MPGFSTQPLRCFVSFFYSRLWLALENCPIGDNFPGINNEEWCVDGGGGGGTVREVELFLEEIFV